MTLTQLPPIRFSGSLRDSIPRFQGFTLTEMLIVVAIIGLLAAILFPVFSRVKDSMRRSTCSSNLRQIGIAMDQYATDHNQRYPAHHTDKCSWVDDLQPYLKSTQVMNCPSNSAGDYKIGCPVDDNSGEEVLYFNGAYIFNGGDENRRQSRIRNPSHYALVLEGQNDQNTTERIFGIGPGVHLIDVNQLDEGGITLNHNDGTNVLFGDGHVKWLFKDALADRTMWTPSGLDHY